MSWFLSHVTRPAYHEGGCHFAPANFSEVPLFLMLKRPFAVLAAASAMDRHGYFSLGVSAVVSGLPIGGSNIANDDCSDCPGSGTGTGVCLDPGLHDASPNLAYDCAFNQVDLQVSTWTFVDQGGGAISVTGSPDPKTCLGRMCKFPFNCSRAIILAPEAYPFRMSG